MRPSIVSSLALIVPLLMSCGSQGGTPVIYTNPRCAVFTEGFPDAPMCTYAPFVPELKDIIAADKIVAEKIARDHPRSSICRSYRKNSWADYIRQCVGIINEKGEPLLWMNYICAGSREDTTGYWKKKIVYVMGGGECYFSGSVNLASRRCEILILNSAR
ncbi:MAG: hypothetical protein JW807_07570 [Spirochaetes bacterium]|nr:hypothetical protein [Spirochaetota bacterium]